MSTPITRLVWQLAGQPPVTGATARTLREVPGVCCVCGLTAEVTAPEAAALGANFTDRGMYAREDSDRVCAACTWCCSGKPPATLRMWSIVAAPGETLTASQPKAWLQDTPGLCLTNRADPRPIADILLAPPGGEWCATVAISGQKHVLPYGRVNHGGGQWTVRMENTDITATPTVWRTVLGRTAALRAAGHADGCVREGAPDLRAVKTPADLNAWREHSTVLAPYLRSPLLDLALWCCTKTTTPTYAALAPDTEDTHDHAHRPGQPAGPDGPDRPLAGRAPQLGLF